MCHKKAKQCLGLGTKTHCDVNWETRWSRNMAGAKEKIGKLRENLKGVYKNKNKKKNKPDGDKNATCGLCEETKTQKCQYGCIALANRAFDNTNNVGKETTK